MVNLVIQTAFLGDLLLSIPLLKKLKRLYPRHHLAIVCRKGFGSILLDLGLVDEAFEIDKSDKQQWKSLFQSLQRLEVDQLVCPHESIRSALVVARLKAEEKVGFSKWWNRPWVFSRTRIRPMELPEALRQYSLLSLIDSQVDEEFSALQRGVQWKNLKARDTVWSWSESEIPEWATLNCRSQIQEKVAMDNLEESVKDVVFLAPGSVWATKRWKIEGYIELGQSLQQEGFDIWLIGSPQERELCERILSQLPHGRNFAGKLSLTEVLRLLTFGRVLVTNDSGAMHMGAVAGIPTVAVFGPTTLELGYRPWSSEAIVVQKELECRPCGKHGAQRCPLGTHACMTQIKAQEVLAAIHKLGSKSN